MEIEECFDLSSDHSAILLTVSNNVIKKSFPCHLSNANTDWTYFKFLVESKVNHSQKMTLTSKFGILPSAFKTQLGKEHQHPNHLYRAITTHLK